MKRMLFTLFIVVLSVLLAVRSPAPVQAQEEYTSAEFCADLNGILTSLEVDEARLHQEIQELEEDLDREGEFAETMLEVINPSASDPDKAYANWAFWMTIFHMRNLMSQIAALQEQLALVEFDWEIFDEIAEVMECEEEMASGEPFVAGATCNVSGGLIGDQLDRLNELTFIVVEDPNPAVDDVRWIEFRVATTYDDGARDPEVWLNRLIEWSEAKQAEGWVELARGSHTQFCNAIAANCITEYKGMSPQMYQDICGEE